MAQSPDFDVRNFGAACNGASDDAPALQAAINALPSSGGNLLIPCKLGIGSAGVKLASKSNITVRGTAAGAGIRSLAPTGQGAQGFGPVAFLVQFCSRCTIRDMEFDGNNVGVVPLGLDRSTDSVVQNNNIHNVGMVAGGAVVSTGGARNQFIGNTITNTAFTSSDGTRGIWVGNANSAEFETSPYIAQNTLQNIGATAIVAHAYTP